MAPGSIRSGLWVIVSGDVSADLPLWADDHGNSAAIFFTSQGAATRFLESCRFLESTESVGSAGATVLSVHSVPTADAMDAIYDLLESNRTAFYALDPPDAQHIKTMSAAEFLTTMIRLAEHHGNSCG